MVAVPTPPGGDAGTRALTPAQQALVLEYHKLAITVARSFNRLYGFRHDFRGECFLALCRAAGQFEASRSVRFATFAIPRLRWACVELLRLGCPRGYRKTIARHGEAPRVEQLDLEEGDVEPREDPTEAMAEAIDRADAIRRALEALTPEQAAVVRACDLGQESLRAYGRRVGISRSAIYAGHRRAMERMRAALAV